MIISTATPDGYSKLQSLGAIMGALKIDTERPDWQEDAAMLMQAMQTIILMGIDDELSKIAFELQQQAKHQ